VGEGSSDRAARIGLVRLCPIALPDRQPLEEERAQGQGVEELERIVLEVLSDGNVRKLGELEVQTMRRFGNRIDETQYREALTELQARRLITVTGQDVRRSEPDFRELELEPHFEAYLSSEAAFGRLSLDREFTVWQRTARGGRAGTGTWSRPDFTIATIRRRKYDPVRHLDLIAFELKNLAGSTVVAVHEALAHTRFAHYAFLVCPRSVLNASVQLAIRDSCAQHGIGLLTFDLSVGKGERPLLKGFEIEVDPRRQSPEPELVDSYIDDRFDEENRGRLLKLSGG